MRSEHERSARATPIAAPAYGVDSPAAAAAPRPPAPDAPLRPRSAVRGALGHAPFLLAAAGILATDSTILAGVWFALCRLGYVGYVGYALRAESEHAALSRRFGAEGAWHRFKDRAAPLMLGDSIALVVLCLVTSGTFESPGPAWLGLAAGALLVVLGIGVKTWAAASLDEGTFYWRDFFVPREHCSVSAAGPYRWLSDPMYSLGYAHAYGFALLLRSGPGLAASAFAQAAILLLAWRVERPHLRRRLGAAADGS